MDPGQRARRLTRRRGLLAAVVGGLLLAGCRVPSFGTPPPATREGGRIQGLWQGFFITALIVGAIVYALIVWCLLRYRKRDDRPPPQFQYHIPLEIFYTSVPVIIVVVLFAFTFRVQNDVLELAPDPDVRVEVSGFQWQWRFHYVNENVDVVGLPNRPPEMVLPTGATVRLVLSSPDVVHSFYVPEFLFKRDLTPGQIDEVDLHVDKTGTFGGACAEFCGVDYASMTFTVRAVSPEEYRTWVASQRRTT